MATKTKEQTVTVMRVEHGEAVFHLLGTTPLVFNRMNEKARRQLLAPTPRRKNVERIDAKHNPIEEYRASVYRTGDGPTLLSFPSPAFKAAMATASLDLPGVAKTQINRLVFVPGFAQNVFGTPKLFMSVVRSADINRTPDIRTRALLPEWGIRVAIRYVMPMLTAETVASLIANAGITVGIGDFRQEKGKGNFGLFEIVEPTDPRWLAVVAQGRAAQEAALEEPETYDADSEELFGWFNATHRKAG